MFRKIKERILAPKEDRKELAWLREQLEPGPVNPELVEVDDISSEFGDDESSDVADYEPVKKKASTLR